MNEQNQQVQPQAFSSPAWLLEIGSEMAEKMRCHDWSSTPLGPPASWQTSLRLSVKLMLDSGFPMFIAWGPELRLVYNDAYAVILGDKHPQALGRPFRDVWAEIWGDVSPLIDKAINGEAVWLEDLPLRMNRHGHDENTTFTFSYSPARNDLDEIVGIFCACTETTIQTQAEAALREREGRLRFFDSLGERLFRSTDASDAMHAATQMLGLTLKASRCAYADVAADADRFYIRSDFNAPGIASSVGEYSLDLFGPRSAAELRAGVTLVVHDVLAELQSGEGREMFRAIGIDAIICCPLIRDGRLAAMMAVHQDQRRAWTDAEVALVKDVVERCWAHVERVGAEARLRESEERLPGGRQCRYWLLGCRSGS